jgi:lysophospholipase L1-like esterase
VTPALLVLTEGGNDILRNISSRVIKENLRAMIEHANSRGIPVVLIGVPQKNLFSSVAPLYRELAEEYALVFDDALLSDLLRTPRYKSDMVHFNEHGYRAMAEAIYALLQDNGAIP